MMIKSVRIMFWIAVVLTALMQVWQEYRIRQWHMPLTVALYPISADSRNPKIHTYIQTLHADHSAALNAFFVREASKYKVRLSRPVQFVMGPQIKQIPPAPPAVDAHWLDILWWSLKFRAFSWTHQPAVGMPVDIRLYLIFHDPAQHPKLLHSTALHKGRIGRVNLFAEASQQAANNVIIAHELLHTLNATDKYAMHTLQPQFPQGYAEPYAQPLYPQSMAEVMAGRIPLTAKRARMASSLDEVVVGWQTAKEIGWIH